MKRVLILHGLGGSPAPHWQSWLNDELSKLGFEVLFPELPNKDNPNLQEWLDVLKKILQEFKPNIVVCHSLANHLWFHLVEYEKVDIVDKLMLVSPVSNSCNISELSSFIPYPLPSDLRAKEVIMASSDNDPYIEVEELISMQSKLNIGLKILPNAGHINAKSGYGELACALEWIQR